MVGVQLVFANAVMFSQRIVSGIDNSRWSFSEQMSGAFWKLKRREVNISFRMVKVISWGSLDIPRTRKLYSRTIDFALETHILHDNAHFSPRNESRFDKRFSIAKWSGSLRFCNSR